MLNNSIGSEFLAPQQMQLFAGTLVGLSPDEIRKAKSLYIRSLPGDSDAISEYKAARASLRGFKAVQGCLAIIPFFWPILWLQRNSINAAMKMYEERITNALAVWRDDLGNEARELEALLVTE